MRKKWRLKMKKWRLEVRDEEKWTLKMKKIEIWRLEKMEDEDRCWRWIKKYGFEK